MSQNRKIKEAIPSYAEKSNSGRSFEGIPRTSWSFNWFKALKQKIEFPVRDDFAEELERRSKFWQTCACGNMCAVIPRCESDGEPHDPKLKQLGLEFTTRVDYAVERQLKADWQEALRLFERIEERSFDLLHQMGVITMKGVYTQRWLKKIQKEEVEA